MTPRAGKTHPCDAGIQRGRSERAKEFRNAAENLRELNEAANSYASLYVLAGIAATDVICCTRLGRFSQSENHADAIRLIREAAPELAPSLQRLLSGKSADAYGATVVSAARATEVRRAAEKLLAAADLL